MADPASRRRMLAFLEAKAMSRVQDYAMRGRALQHLPDEEAVARWKAAILALGERGLEASVCAAEDDARSELVLRRIEPPWDDPDVKAAMATLAAVCDAAMAALTRERRSAIGETLVADMDAALGAGEPKN